MSFSVEITELSQGRAFVVAVALASLFGCTGEAPAPRADRLPPSSAPAIPPGRVDAYRITEVSTDGQGPVALAIDETARSLWVANATSGTLHETTLRGLKPGTTIALKPGLSHLAIDHARRRLVAIDEFTEREGWIVDLREGRVSATIAARGISDVVIDQMSGLIYATQQSRGDVLVVEGESGRIIRRLKVGGEVSSLALDEAADRLFVAQLQGKRIAVIDTQSGVVTERIELRAHPTKLLIDPETGRIITLGSERSISVVDPAAGREIAFTETRYQPTDVAIDGERRRLYVSEDPSDIESSASFGTVSVWGLQLRRLDVLRVGPGPRSVEVEERGGRVFVALARRDAVAVIRPK